MRILAITVGGTPDPVRISILDHRPDRVVFFVTEEPNGGSRRLVLDGTAGKAGIVAEVGLGEGAYEIAALDHPDDFAPTYSAMHNVLLRLQRENPDAEFIADYTGGTKTMSAAMAAAAAHLGWKLSLVTGVREGLDRVTVTGTSCLQSVTPLLLDDLVDQVKVLVEARHHAGAQDLVRGALAELVLDSERKETLTRLATLLHGLALWDRFRYADAHDHLRACGAQCGDVLPHLARLAEFAESEDDPPYELVVDLVANAQGRGLQHRYEDAVLRLYRAVELLAQIRLKTKYDLDTGDLNPDRLPPSLREELVSRRGKGKGPITAGLVDAYRILSELGDPLGQVFKDGWDTRLRDLLLLRNKAFMEHGFRPLGEKEWNRARELVLCFLGMCFHALKLTFKVPSPPSWPQIKELLTG